MAHLVFAIDAGKIEWLASHETKDEAIEHLNNLRPDGTRSDWDDMPTAAEYEFAFIIESSHFVSFV